MLRPTPETLAPPPLGRHAALQQAPRAIQKLGRGMRREMTGDRDHLRAERDAADARPQRCSRKRITWSFMG